jgi:hypothetical protein
MYHETHLFSLQSTPGGCELQQERQHLLSKKMRALYQEKSQRKTADSSMAVSGIQKESSL